MLSQMLRPDSRDIKQKSLMSWKKLGELKRVILMHNTIKLLPILLLGSTISGCSMAGFGDFHGDGFSSCGVEAPVFCGDSFPAAQNTVVSQPCRVELPSACDHGYTVAQNTVAAQPYSGYAAAPSQYAAQPAVAAPAPYVAAQPAAASYGSQLYAQQPYLEAAPTYAGYQGQQAYAPAYVNPQPRASKGLRQAYTYGSLGATLYDVDSDLYGIQGRLGWQSASVFGVEVEGSYGFNEDEATVDFGGGPVAAESGIETQIAAFGVVRYPVSDRINVLTRVGYHSTEFEAEFDDGTTVLEQDFSTDGVAYGLGVEYALNQRTSVRADYTRYDFDGPEADALSLAIARKF